MMLRAEITYLNVSAEQAWNDKKGHFVELAYRVDVSDLPEDLRRFDYIENIIFRMEWQEQVDGMDWLVTEREHAPFPDRVVLVGNASEVIGRHKTFLDRKFLTWEGKFFTRANLFCRVSLTPVLASVRVPIEMDRETGYYVLDATTKGNPPLAPSTPTVIY